LWDQDRNPITHHVQDKDFLIYDCTDPVIRINDKESKDQPKGIVYDVSIHATQLTATPAGWLFDSSRQVWMLRLKCSGNVTSVKASETELVPTYLEQIIDGSIISIGLFGLLAVGIVYVFGRILNRAFDVLLEYMIPDPPKD
jgi:hypothetical protein